MEGSAETLRATLHDQAEDRHGPDDDGDRCMSRKTVKRTSRAGRCRSWPDTSHENGLKRSPTRWKGRGAIPRRAPRFAPRRRHFATSGVAASHGSREPFARRR